MQREFDSEPVYNGKYLETKIKSYNGKINPNIGNNKIPNEVNPQVLLEECKQGVKEKRMLMTQIFPKMILIEKILIKKTLKENSNEKNSIVENYLQNAFTFYNFISRMAHP